MDQTRRSTLKAIGATGIGMASGGLAPVATSYASTDRQSTNAQATHRFSVQIEHSWGGSNVSVVIKNTSGQAATISNVTPAYLSAEPGLFDFSKVTANGPLTLAANEEIRIPFTPMGSPAAPVGHFDRSIQKRLRDTLRIQTDQLQIAQTTTTLNPRIV